MGRVGRQVEEERLVVVLAFADPPNGFVEEDLGAVTRVAHALAVAAVDVVEVVVLPVVGRRTDVRRGEP